MSSVRPTIPPGSQRSSCPPGQRSSRIHHDVAGPVSDHRKTDPPERRQDQLTALPGRRRAQLRVEDLAVELVFEHVQSAPLRTGIAERTDLGQPGVLEANALRSPPRSASGRCQAMPRARRCRSHARSTPAPARGPPPQPPRAGEGRRSGCRRGRLLPGRRSSATAGPKSFLPAAPTSPPAAEAPPRWPRTERGGRTSTPGRHGRPPAPRRQSGCGRRAPPTRPNPRPVSRTRRGAPVVPLV